MIFAALVISFVFSILVYIGVENPMRRYKGIANKYVIACLTGCLFLLFGLGQVIRDCDGFESRSINDKFSSVWANNNDWTYPKNLHKHEINLVSLYVSDKTKFPEILFIGDSHVEQYAERALVLANRTGKSVAFLTVGGCFVPTGHHYQNNESCRNMSKSVDRLLQDFRFKTVVFGEMWGAYLKRPSSMFEKGMQVMRAWVDKRQDVNFYVLLDYPWDNHSYDIRNRLVIRRWVDEVVSPKDYIVDYPSDYNWRFGNEKVVEHLKNWVRFIETESQVCPNKKCNLIKSYKDDDHLRASYVKEHATWIDQVFE